MATLEAVKKAVEKQKLKGSWATRDSAVKVLRKLGAVTKEVVKELLVERPDGRWGIAGVPELETKSKGAAPSPPSAEDKAAAVPQEAPQHKPKTVPMSTKEKKVTITSVMRALILEGKTNKEVFEEAQRILGADRVCHQTHPAWHRSKMRSEGLLPPK